MRSNKHIYTSVLIINIHYIQNNVIKRRKFSASDFFFLNYWNTSLQNKLQTDKLKPILLISEGHLQNGPMWSEQKVSSGHYEGVLSAQFKAVDGLVQQQDLQGQGYCCPRDSTVQVSSKRSCFLPPPHSVPPHSLISFMSQHFALGRPVLL